MNRYTNRHHAVPDQHRSALRRLLIATAISTGLMALPLALDNFIDIDTGAVAVAGNGNGQGGGSGGGGSGGGGSGGGGGKPDKGDLYGDMVYVLRNADGVPILFTDQTSEGESFSCLLPLAIGTYWYDGEWVTWTAEDGQVLPLVAQYPDSEPDSTTQIYSFCNSASTVDATIRLNTLDRRAALRDRDRDRDMDGEGDRDLDRLRDRDRDHLYSPYTPVRADDEESDPDYCDVIKMCADDVMEVELGRLSVLRAPERVLDRQRDEAIRTIEQAYPAVELDHGGRLVVNGATFDSPLINLALMREFLNWGELGGDVWMPPEPSLGFPDHYTPMLAAAFGLAAGDDKLGNGLDPEVVVRSYHTIDVPSVTAYLSLVDTSGVYDPSGLLREYLDFSDFSYDRESVFTGAICWDQLDGTYTRHADTVMNLLFGGENYVGKGLAAFAQAAEDSRQVMLYVHDGLVYYVDPVFQANFDGIYPHPEFCPELSPTP